MVAHSKVPVVCRDDYFMYLEYHNDLLWFHTDVKKWNQTIKKRFLEDLNLLQYLVTVPLVALVETDNKKLKKFGEVLGWNQTDKIKLNNGKEAYIYMWSK
jgi:hypothetical protein